MSQGLLEGTQLKDANYKPGTLVDNGHWRVEFDSMVQGKFLQNAYGVLRRSDRGGWNRSWYRPEYAQGIWGSNRQRNREPDRLSILLRLRTSSRLRDRSMRLSLLMPHCAG